MIERVLFWDWGHVYYQSLCLLIDRYPFCYRLGLGLLLGGIGPGLVWTIGSQLIMFKFHDSLHDYEDDLGYMDYTPIAEPGQPTITMYWIYTGLMTAVLGAIYAAYLYCFGGPDGSHTYRNAIVWGLPYSCLLFWKQATPQ